MATRAQELKTCQVYPDGEGGFVLKGILPDGGHVVFPLTHTRALWLLKAAAEAALTLKPEAKS